MRLLDRHQCEARLRLIFPAGVADDPRAVSGPLAGAAVYVCVYCGSFEGRNPLRPSTVLWMCDAVAARAAAAPTDEFFAERDRWYRAAVRGHHALLELLAEWGISHRPWYADNSREPLRDETFREWARLGAMEHDSSLPTTSPRPAWTLRGQFASLFRPELGGGELAEAIAIWQGAHLGIVGRARVRVEERRRAAAHAVEVRLPDGSVRPLSPGESSLILKGVIEELAPRLMRSPGVLAISQSSRKVDVADEELLRELGIAIQADGLLPDAILFDAAAERFWFVEAVATDGEIHAQRKAELLAWAADHGIDEQQCAFVTAFLSRNAAPFRRRVARLSWGTHVWFLDEPDRIMRLDELAP